LARSVLIDFLDGYEEVRTEDGRVTNAGKRFFSRSYSGSMTEGKQKITRMKVFRLSAAISRILAYTKTKSYGAAALSYGLLTLLISFTKSYGSLPTGEEGVAMIIGIIFSLFAVPLLFFDKPISLFLQDYTITDYIFFELFCLKRTQKRENTRGIPTPIAAIFGILVGMFEMFLPAWQVTYLILTVAVICLALSSPEFAFFFSILTFPYLSLIPSSEWMFSALVAIGAFSFIKKSFLGKRVIYFEQYDVLIAALLTVILLSGIFLKGTDSFAGALILVFMSLGHFLAGNIITNRRLADCTFNALVASSVIPSLLSVILTIRALVTYNANLTLQYGCKSTFDSTEALATFLIVSITFGVALIKESRGKRKFVYSLIVLLNSVSIILSGEYFAVLALLIGIFAYFALKARNMSALLLPLLLAIPYLIFLIPREALDRFFSLLPMNSDLLPSELLSLWSISLRAFLDNIFLGIGIGAESFVGEMSGYGVNGTDSSSNLFIELGLEAGIFALAIFAILLFVRLRHRARYHSYVINSQLSVISPITSVANLCLIAYGTNHYVWENFASFYLFFAVFGIGSAALRVTKRERDERILYYEHTKRVHSAAIDIDIE